VVLSVAGSDSGGGAGVEADLRALASEGVWGAVAITAITAQNTQGVLATMAVDPQMVGTQIDAVVADMDVAAVKTGMLCGAQTVSIVAERLVDAGVARVVVDPVVLSTSGTPLLDRQGVDALRELLLPICTIVTPNIPEAELLAGGTIRGRQDMIAAGRELVALGAASVLLKGGHLAQSDEAGSPDLLICSGEESWLDAPRVPGGGAHGSGCVLSALIAARLAVGDSLAAACFGAKRSVIRALQGAISLGSGAKVLWPGGPPGAEI
jgi:hydroxymethylpyrimidine/phosphomethylpyrimidine kinase